VLLWQSSKGRGDDTLKLEVRDETPGVVPKMPPVGGTVKYGMLVKGIAGLPDAAESLDFVVDRLMEALLDLGVDDPAVSATRSDMTIEIEMVVEADNPADAVSQTEATITDAITKMGGQVPPGGVADAFQEWTARREDALTPA
jgi:hypothetical protein